MAENAFLKNLKNSQDELRLRLVKVYKKNPVTMAALAKKIGVSSVTIIAFLNGRDVDYARLIKIENFIEQQEEILSAEKAKK